MEPPRGQDACTSLGGGLNPQLDLATLGVGQSVGGVVVDQVELFRFDSLRKRLIFDQAQLKCFAIGR